MAFINFVKQLEIGEGTTFEIISGIVSGLSYTEGDISHNYVNNEFNDVPIFDSPTQDPATLTFQVADLSPLFFNKYFQAGVVGNVVTLPTTVPTLTNKIVKLTFNTGQVIEIPCNITAKNIGEDLKTSAWKCELECTVTSIANVLEGVKITFGGSGSGTTPNVSISYNSSTHTVTMANGNEGVIYYTTDGTTPTTASSTYTSGITLESGDTIIFKAFAVAEGKNPSDVAELIATY